MKRCYRRLNSATKRLKRNSAKKVRAILIWEKMGFNPILFTREYFTYVTIELQYCYEKSLYFQKKSN